MGGIEERWDYPSKPADRRKSGIMLGLVLGEGEREARPSLLHSLSRSVQRIQPNITFIFSPNFVGMETPAMQQSETPFCFSKKTKQKLGIFTSGIGKSGYS